MTKHTEYRKVSIVDISITKRNMYTGLTGGIIDRNYSIYIG